MKAGPVLKTLFLVLAVVAAASNSYARTDAEIRESVQELLMERHPKDTPEWWRGLGANAPAVLIAMYEESSHTYHRIRLLQGLGWFDSPVAVEFLKKQADGATDDVLRNTSLRSIGFAGGARETEFLSKFLSHSDPQTRLTAAETLKKIHDPRAQALVEKFIREEKTPWIVAKLHGELPQPKGILTQSSSTEDRLNAELDGRFVGYWVIPRGAAEEGMSAVSAVLNLKQSSPTELTGELILEYKQKKGSRFETWKLGRLGGKGNKISGVVQRSSGSLPFDGELTLDAGEKVLELHVRKLAGTLVVRKKKAE